MGLVEMLHRAVELNGSDIFIIPGSGVTVKINSKMISLSEGKLVPKDTEELVREMYGLAHRNFSLLEEEGDDDFSFAILNVSRFRCNAYKQRGTIAAICRIVNFELPDAETMHVPELVMNLSRLLSGMVLVTGPAGSGKSTTLACIVDKINSEREAHIVTIEDPIEYLHRHKCSLVSQREVPNDASSFSRALRAALR